MGREEQQQAAGPVYQPGEVYSFRPSPATEFSHADTGRYATFKVLGTKDGQRYIGRPYLSGLEMEIQFHDSYIAAQIQEKLKLLGYFSQCGQLPPGNEIWR